MEHRIAVGIGLVLFSNMVAAVSQVLLKRAAKREVSKWWRAYVNPLVIIAYLLFLETTLLSVVALRYIPLSLSAALGASGQIFVPILSYFVLQEQISRKRCVGMLTIVVGIVISSL